jgi:hypothetical protein
MNMHSMRYSLVAVVFLGVMLVTACNFPVSNSPTQVPDSVRTAAAQTVEVLRTQLAVQTLPATLLPSDATATQSPANPQSTPTTLLSLTATNQPILCDRAGFIGETIPDDTPMVKGSAFTKTWTLKNTGTCTWTSAYTLVFVKGDAMAGQSRQFTNAPVAPDQTVQISVDLRAPLTKDSARGDWMLRNADGVLFGLGPDATQTIWVQIKITELSNSLLDDMCTAVWRNGTDVLPCPGTAGDVKGFVMKVDNPKFENGTIENEPALWMNPQAATDGVITGEFPPIKIMAGSHFRTVLGCQLNANHCDVIFSVTYRADGGPETLLNEWHEFYDNNWTKVDENLSALVGKSVVFTLYVKANGVSDQDEALWLLPKIAP